MNEFANLLFNDRNNPRNFVEDFAHENGNYMVRCYSCGEFFLGHKRRFTCKLCYDNPLTLEQKETANQKIKQTWQDAFERLKLDESQNKQ